MPRISVSGNAPDIESQWTQLYLGLGFTTLATLLLDLSLHRLFSVVFFPSFAYVAIALALFGQSVGGLFSYVIANRPGNLSSELGRLTFINAVVVILLLWFLLSRHGEMSISALAIVSLVSAVPFFFAGAVLSLAVSEAIGRIGRAYLWNLMGASAACLLLGPFLTFFGGPNTVIASGVIYGIAASIWFNRAGQAQLRASAALVSLLLVTFMIMNGTNHMFDVRWAKGERIPEERLAKWNSVSRVSVSKDSNDIRIDANAPLRLPGGARIPYLMRPGAKALILGAMGGYDLPNKGITVVEPNSIVADLVRGEFPPGARFHLEDPRSFIRRTQEKYQIIQATSAEAIEDYLAHLTGDGILALTDSSFDWRSYVTKDTSRQVIVLNEVVLISRTPLSEADLEHVSHTASETGIEVLYLPGADLPTGSIAPKASFESLYYYGLMALALLATALVMLLPRLVVPAQQGIYASLLYFLFSGAAYALVQIALIQKLTVLLGQPGRALTVIAFSMLIASGAGSYFSKAFDRGLPIILAGAGALVAALAAVPLTSIAAGWPTPARIFLVIAAIAPAAFLMGMPFPSGLRRLEERHAPALRWAWSLNAAASVMGAVASIVLAIHLGLRATLLIGGALYLGAMLIVLVTRRESHPA